MNSIHYGKRAFAAAIVGTLALAACGSGTSAAPAPASPAAPASAHPSGASGTLQSLVDGARKEGALTLSYGGGSLGGNQGIQKLGQAFNKAYGLNINVQLSPGAGMPAMVAKITQSL